MKVAFRFGFAEEQGLKITILPIHRRLPASPLGGLDCPNSCAVCLRRDPEDRIADYRRIGHVQRRRHAGRQFVGRAYDGLGHDFDLYIIEQQLNSL